LVTDLTIFFEVFLISLVFVFETFFLVFVTLGIALI